MKLLLAALLWLLPVAAWSQAPANPPVGSVWTYDTSGPVWKAPVLTGACGLPDATATINAAITALPNGGTVTLPACPLTVAGQVIIDKPNIRLTGVGAPYYPGMLDMSSSGTPVAPTWPPAASTSVNCTGTSVSACLMVKAIGVEIDHINFGNPQPTPPAACPASGPCNNFVPTNYPFVVSTDPVGNWNGLHIHNLTFTSANKCIALTGTPDYNTTGIAGAQWTINDLWFNPCLQTGILFKNIDNTGRISNIDMDFWWYRNNSPVGWYMERNSVGFDIQYLANAQFNNIEFLYNKVGFQFTNSTVGGGFGGTFSAVKLQLTNISFNLTCQGMSTPNGNGTMTQGVMTNIVLAQDDTHVSADGSPNCAAATAFLDLSTDQSHWTFANMQANAVQTLASIGATAAGTTGSHAILRLYDIDVLGYSAFSAGAPAFKVVAGTDFALNTDSTAIRPSTGAGNLLGPGVDGSQGYSEMRCVGGGTKSLEGAACIRGSQNIPGASGSLVLFDPNNVEQAYIGQAGATGVNIVHRNGSIFLKPKNGASTVQFGVDGANKNLVNMTPLPTTPPSGTGAAYLCVDSLGNLYVKGSCP